MFAPTIIEVNMIHSRAVAAPSELRTFPVLSPDWPRRGHTCPGAHPAEQRWCRGLCYASHARAAV